MQTSRVPAAIDALLAILQARSALEDVAVVDGPASVNLTQRRRIHIGWSPNAEQAVEIQQQFNAAGARTRDEAFSITCYAESRGGDKDMSFRRSDAFDLIGEVEQAMRASDSNPTAPTLNGSVLWAELTTGNVLQDTAEGALVGVVFAVTCRARI
ncbi:hypothetical protein OHB41_25815 [Streptomyces sp. NBC_01571]|uniref:hypothetical protein n=1 Tax=Streptomyces sp. NBC_01571 TaxID=2975883 RepID=UPI00224D039D|nr:hypothetical protein [Streptomyces sp. NBC_01571]MCX4576528.1 hypothetical protein [Streptomyces sp. NBC_01571]